MNYKLTLDNMPDFVVNAYGQAQKTLTQFEGEARKYVNTTYTKIKDYPTVKNFSNVVDGYWTKYSTYLKTEPIWNNVEKFGAEIKTKAVATIGEVRKLTNYKKKETPKKTAAKETPKKTATKK